MGGVKNLNKLALWGLLALWGGLVAVSFAWNYRNLRSVDENLATGTAKAFFQQLLVTRQWAAMHGGVFVPTTSQTPPNPFLSPGGRDFTLPGGTAYTKLNPAYITRQLSDLAEQHQGVKFHLTSLKPLRPENAPNPWERRALETFERGAREASEFVGGAFLYMAPLAVEPECLACHASQGYHVGDVRGGIRITFPEITRSSPLGLGLGHLALGLVGAFFIGFFGLRLLAAYENLSTQATQDSLTRLPNRRYFYERFQQEFRRAKRSGSPLSVLMCDIDHFKAYNDFYGHLAGDECLKSVAKAIASSARRGGDVAARFGGEEFILMLPDTDLAGAVEIAQGIVGAVGGLGIPHAQSVAASRVTVSVGVAMLDSGRELTEAELIDHADLALYRAKALGRNQVVVFGAAS